MRHLSWWLMALLLSVAPASAQDAVQVGAITHHFRVSQQPNNLNLGGAVEWRQGKRAIDVGVYRNSDKRLTIGAVVGIMSTQGPVHVGILAGAATGFDIPVIPTLLFVAEVKRVRVLIVPSPWPIVSVNYVAWRRH